MNLNYEVVPNIISSKDLDYLSDMFNWNYGAIKSSFNSIDKINDLKLKNIVEKATNIFQKNMTNILNIINGGNNEQSN